MPTSNAQLAANRRNAARSTGPRTPAGKAAVRLNAVTHGIYAADLVASAGSAGESQDDFTAFLTDLTDAYQPGGPLEIILVNRIASLHWRLQRVVRAESGEIARALHTVPDDLRRRRRAGAARAFDALLAAAALPAADRGPAARQALDRLTASSEGLSLLRILLEKAREHLAAHGSLTSSLVRYVRAAAPSEAIRRALPLLPSPGSVNPPSPASLPSPDALLAALDAGIENLTSQIEAARKRERAQEEALRRSLALPSMPAADKLLRYEKALSGQLSRAIHELNRLQAQRLRRDEF